VRCLELDPVVGLAALPVPSAGCRVVQPHAPRFLAETGFVAERTHLLAGRRVRPYERAAPEASRPKEPIPKEFCQVQREPAFGRWPSAVAAEDAGDDDDDEEAADEDDDEGPSGGKAKGFTLVFDVVRRFAQPLGIDLPKWEGRIIEIKKGVVRLLPIGERARQLFGEDGAQAVAARLELETSLGPTPLQGMLFPEMETTPRIRGRGPRGRSGRMGVEVSDKSFAAALEATTLDRVHAAMLLQAGGRTNALRALLKAEDERGPDFLRLANALSALYPKGSEEKRLLDAMLLAVTR
jgi:putative DNA methylase